MSDEPAFTPEMRDAMVDGLSLSLMVDVDNVFDEFPEWQEPPCRRAAVGASPWRAVFALRGPFMAIASRSKPATLDLLMGRQWVVMTFGFAAKGDAIRAGRAWHEQVLSMLDHCRQVRFLRAQQFAPDWRGRRIEPYAFPMPGDFPKYRRRGS